MTNEAPKLITVTSQIDIAQKFGMEANIEKLKGRAEKLSELRKLMRSDFFQIYLSQLAESCKWPILAVYNDGATTSACQIISRDYTIPFRHTVIAFRYDKETGHQYLLFPKTANYDDPPVLGGRTITKSTKGRSETLLLTRHPHTLRISGLPQKSNPNGPSEIIPGFRFYDEAEIQNAIRPGRMIDRFRQNQERRALVNAATSKIRLPFVDALDPRSLLRRRVDGQGKIEYDNLASDSMIPLLDAFNMDTIIAAIAFQIASGV